MFDIDSVTAGLLKRVLAENKFFNPDIGAINDVLDCDYFIVSPPKCGTTAIQRGFERIGGKVIHAHTNRSTFQAFQNGNILRENGLGMETLIARAQTNKRPIHLFFGYRDPVDWYVSLAGHFNLALTEKLMENILYKINDCEPWISYRPCEIASLVYEATKMSLFDVKFDFDLGLGLSNSEGVNVVLYRFDKINAVEEYIVRYIDRRFEISKERVNNDAQYLKYKEEIRLNPGVVGKLFEDPIAKHFYSKHEIRELVKFYTRDPRTE